MTDSTLLMESCHINHPTSAWPSSTPVVALYTPLSTLQLSVKLWHHTPIAVRLPSVACRKLLVQPGWQRRVSLHPSPRLLRRQAPCPQLWLLAHPASALCGSGAALNSANIYACSASGAVLSNGQCSCPSGTTINSSGTAVSSPFPLPLPPGLIGPFPYSSMFRLL